MTNPTSNFNWQMPTPTDLVTDLPADFEVFGQAVDTSMADLLGGTTGQILAKASNSNMDFAWITNDQGDITAVNVTSPITGGGSAGAVTIGINAATTSVVGAVQLSDSTSTTSSVLASTPTATKSAYDLADAAVPKSTVTTAGDVIYGTGSAAVTRLGIGTAGQVLRVNSGATAPEWATPASAGVNLLLNSNFALNQRGYVSAANLASGAYGFDRWKSNYTNTTLTFTANTQGQELTINASGGLQQVIEQGLVPAGTYTLSWTGTATARVYNSGGTPPSYAASPVTFTADGAANVVVEFTAVSTTKTVSKVQFNAGTNTNWALATPTLQSELAACQRYFYRMANGNNAPLGIANFVNASTAWGCVFFPVTMRTAPTLTAASGTNYYMSYFGSVVNFNTLTNGNGYITTTTGQVGVSSLSGNTAGYATSLITTNAATTVDWSSEL
jgi:hypothetical protein